jgi:hypothetical protein
MMCNQPMHRLRAIRVPNGPDITVWRCRFCLRPQFKDQAAANLGELDARRLESAGPENLDGIAHEIKQHLR